MSETAKYVCKCNCHATVEVHTTIKCSCGKVITPEPCPSRDHKCIPPIGKQQPGTVELPQPIPPFHVPRCETLFTKSARPLAGTPEENTRFEAKASRILRKGPCFGPRKDEFLPYLLIRAASNDRGARPYTGVTWESPDIFVVPNQEAISAPPVPSTLGGIAQANAPNTVYAHIWNLGKAPVYRARVEFYWFNPSLGWSRANANLIGATWVDLENRFTLYPEWRKRSGPSGTFYSRGSHALVRCPTTWVPTYENQGHECLIVRVFDPFLDPVSPEQFSAAADRHVGQRNIAVIEASSPAAIDLNLSLGYYTQPVMAHIDLTVESPSSMEWLKLLTNSSQTNLQPTTSSIIAGFMPPEVDNARNPNVSDLPIHSRGTMLSTIERFQRGCDPLKIPFHATIEDLRQNEAQVIRIRQHLEGVGVFGGYTVVLIGKNSFRMARR